MDPLSELARKYGTDKGGEHIPYGDVNHCCHVYTPIYWDLFKELQGRPINLLEIGVSEGYSIRMWREFFPRATIYGWDNAINRFEGEMLPAVELASVDQSDVASLVGAWNKAGRPLFDIIIDDGSHIFDHQRITYSALLPALKPTGIYVIEDETTPLPVNPPFQNQVLRWPDQRDMMQIIRSV